MICANALTNRRVRFRRRHHKPGLLLGGELFVVVTGLGFFRMLQNERSVLDFLHQPRQASFFLMLVLFLFLLLLLFSLWFAGLWLGQGSELLVDSLQLYQEREANYSQQGNDTKQTTTKTTTTTRRQQSFFSSWSDCRASHEPALGAQPIAGLAPLQSRQWRTRIRRRSRWSCLRRRQRGLKEAGA